MFDQRVRWNANTNFVPFSTAYRSIVPRPLGRKVVQLHSYGLMRQPQANGIAGGRRAISALLMSRLRADDANSDVD
jgi:hypothetical protein